MFRELLESGRQRHYKALAPIVLTAGYRQAFGQDPETFHLVHLTRGTSKLTSGSTQPWMLLGAASVLEAEGHIERTTNYPEQDCWENTAAYIVTDLGKLSIARSVDLMHPPAGLSPAMLDELDAINIVNTIPNAGN